MLKLEINGRTLIPVRLIPFVTFWKFSLVANADALADPSNVSELTFPFFTLTTEDSYQPFPAETWSKVVRRLKELADTSSNAGTEVESNRQLLQESIKTLPAATFAWLDDVEAAWQAAHSKFCQALNISLTTQPLYLSAWIPADLVAVVYEGFELLIARPVVSGDSPPYGKVSLSELVYYLGLDPYYGVESLATESIINSTYRKNTGNDFYVRFRRQFARIPCKKDKQRHLIYLWCGLMGLPAYRNSSRLDWQWHQFLEHWTKDFEVRLDDLKVFLRDHGWPLPTGLYPDEADNTERKLILSNADYEAAVSVSRMSPEQNQPRDNGKAPPNRAEESEQEANQSTRIQPKNPDIGSKTPALESNSSLAPTEENEFIFTGDHWRISFEGVTKTFNKTKGLSYIAHLILHQGQEIAASSLYYTINPPDADAADPTLSAMSQDQLRVTGLSVSGDLGGAGEMLDLKTIQTVKQKGTELKEQIEDAIELGDWERKHELQEELAQIGDYLTAGTGLGGRTRTASSTSQRLRLSVTKRIKADIKKIAGSLPRLGSHLRTHVGTGMVCVYSPDPPVTWKVSMK